MVSPILPRTLRAANAGLYMACVLFVMGACVYVLCTKELSQGAAWATVVCGALCSLWGVYYMLLRIRICEAGMTRIAFFRAKTFSWQSFSGAEIEETEQNGMASCKITLHFAGDSLVLSSELFSLDALQELATELRSAGMLPALTQP